MGTNSSYNPKYDLRDEGHFYVEWFSGTGKGGQHRNKHQNSCRLYHLPTGIVETRQGRSRENNLKDAREALIKTLDAAKNSERFAEESLQRKEQVGSGMRGDKRRTYRFQDDQVIDHILNNSAKCSQIMKGKVDLLW